MFTQAQKKNTVRKTTLLTFVQTVFLSASFFIQNDLLTYAAACAFNFMMSVIPVVMMILSVLLRLLHTAPELLAGFMPAEPSADNLFSVNRMTQALAAMEHTGVLFEIIAGVSLFLMARRFFVSVMTGLSCIFHRYAPERPMIVTLLSLAGEVLLIIIVSVLIAAVTAAQPLLNTELLSAFIPQVLQDMLEQLLYFVPDTLLFCFVTICYRAGSRTSPRLYLCAAGALCCTVSFAAVRIAFRLFLDMSRYNLIYGVLSGTIVLLLEVFIFFVLFLFFAQYIFVLQFFDDLLLAELYLLPDRSTLKPVPALRRLLFINPARLTQNDGAVFYCAPDAVIYQAGDAADSVFYIAEGTVELLQPNRVRFYERGQFFGEVSALLPQQRLATARAATAVQLIRIDRGAFMRMAQSNPDVSKKALAQIMSFTSYR